MKEIRRLDDDGYPTDAILKVLRDWDFMKDTLNDFLALTEDLWSYKDRFVLKGKRILRLYLSTGGWSGNENVLEAIKSNRIFWMFCWQKSIRGGHYWFKIDKKCFNGSSKTA